MATKKNQTPIEDLPEDLPQAQVENVEEEVTAKRQSSKEPYVPTTVEQERLKNLPWDEVITPRTGLTLDVILKGGEKKIIKPLAEGRYTEVPIGYYRNNNKHYPATGTLAILTGYDKDKKEFFNYLSVHDVLRVNDVTYDGVAHQHYETLPFADLDREPYSPDERKLKGGKTLTQDEIISLNETGSLGHLFEYKTTDKDGSVSVRRYIVSADPYSYKPALVFMDADKLKNRFLENKGVNGREKYVFRTKKMADGTEKEIPMTVKLFNKEHTLTIKEALILLEGKPIFLEHVGKESGKTTKWPVMLSAFNGYPRQAVNRIRYAQEKKEALRNYEKELLSKKAANEESKAISEAPVEAPAQAAVQAPAPQVQEEPRKVTRSFRNK